MFWIRKTIFSFTALVAFVSISWGQSVGWNPSRGTLQQGKGNLIELRFNSCEAVGEIVLPTIDGMTLVHRNTSNNTSIVNGRRSSQVIYTYVASPNRQGQIVIPFFEVETNIGKVPVQEARFETVAATVGDTGISPDKIFLTQLQPPAKSLYVGEVFNLTYIAGAKQEYQLADISNLEWAPTTLATLGLKETQSGAFEWQGERYGAKAYQAQVMATESGVIQLPPIKQTMTVVVGRRREFLFAEPVYDSFEIESDPISIPITPLPENAPASFLGAVGSFELQSRVVPEQVQIGEPVTWTLELSGSGNWPSGIGVPSRAASNSFRTIQPEIKNEFAEGDLFNGKQSEDIVLIPTEEGTFTFGPLDYTYFNPEIAEYTTISIPAKTVTVTVAETNGAGTIASTPSSVPEAPELTLDPTGENSSRREPFLPREPVSGLTPRATPVGHIALTRPIAIAVATPVFIWILLAASRSIYLDPSKNRRKAFASLKNFTAKHSAIANTKEEQLAWRKHVAAYWNVSTKEPTPLEIENAVKQYASEQTAKSWKALWQESDNVLFRKGNIESSQWKKSFSEILKASPKPKRIFSKFFSRDSWISCLLFAFTILATSSNVQADDTQDLYNAGDFEKAATLWNSEVQGNPTAWESRYNSGLAAAQQENWGKAWAYWTSAFCLNPHDARIEWNLKLAHTHTSSYDDTLHSLVENDGVFRIVRLRSPAEWEQVAKYSLIGSTVILALAVILIYLPALRRMSLPLLFLGIACLLIAPFSKWAHSKYGTLTDPQCVLITQNAEMLSVPTELGENQITANLRDGTIARLQKSFLGWSKIELPNGDIGWVRKEAFIHLYGSTKL